MLRSPASLLLRLAQRAPLARAALPLLAAYAPELAAYAQEARGCARSLHVFARRPNANHSKVEVGEGADVSDLKDAVCAKLRLDAPPDCVLLLREVEGGGAPVPLDSRRALAEQGVREGTSVLIEVLLPPPAPLAPPLTPPQAPPLTAPVRGRSLRGCSKAVTLQSRYAPKPLRAAPKGRRSSRDGWIAADETARGAPRERRIGRRHGEWRRIER